MIRKNENQIIQLMTEGEYGGSHLINWYENEEQAKEEMAHRLSIWPDSVMWLEKGTDEINQKCRHCGTVYCSECYDHYGYSTGFWCDDCYKNHYPYRKDAYFDPLYAGERLEDDY